MIMSRDANRNNPKSGLLQFPLAERESRSEGHLRPADGARVSGSSGLMLASADGMLYATRSNFFDEVYLIEASPAMP